MTRPAEPVDGDLSSLLGAHAVNATEELERARIERAIATGDADTAELASFMETAALLGWSVAETPPPELRAAVLDAITTTRQEPPIIAPPAVRRPRRRLPLVAAAAAAVIALASFALGTVTGRSSQGGTDATAALATAERVVTLRGPGAGTVRVAQHQDGSLRVVTEGVPAPSAGTTYQLWTIDGGGAPQPAGLFGAGGNQFVSTLPASAAPGLATATALAVTVEPASGSPAPTSPIRYQASV